MRILDSDVIIHFLKSGQKELLYDIFEEPIFILNIIRAEYTRNGQTPSEFDQFIKFSKEKIQEIPFPQDVEDPIVHEYAKLTTIIDKGEAACIAYAKEKQAIFEQ